MTAEYNELSGGERIPATDREQLSVERTESGAVVEGAENWSDVESRPGNESPLIKGIREDIEKLDYSEIPDDFPPERGEEQLESAHDGIAIVQDDFILVRRVIESPRIDPTDSGNLNRVVGTINSNIR